MLFFWKRNKSPMSKCMSASTCNRFEWFLMEFVGIAVPPGMMDPVQLAFSNASCASQQATSNTRTRCLQQTGLIGPTNSNHQDQTSKPKWTLSSPHTKFIPLQSRYLARELTFGSRLLNGVTPSTYENQSLPSIDDHRGSGSIPAGIFTRAPEHSWNVTSDS